MAKEKVDWRCTKDRAGAYSCLGYRDGKRTLVSLYNDGVINISGKDIECKKVSVLSSDVMLCKSEISGK